MGATAVNRRLKYEISSPTLVPRLDRSPEGHMTQEEHTPKSTNPKPKTIPNLEPNPLSTKQIRAYVAKAIASLETQGIRDWEILEAWSDITWKAGNKKATKVLEKAAQELKEAMRSQITESLELD